MGRLLLALSVLILFSCEGAEPQLVDLFAGKKNNNTTIPASFGDGRIVVGADSSVYVTPNYKVRSRVASTPQQHLGATTNYRVRGNVEL